MAENETEEQNDVEEPKGGSKKLIVIAVVLIVLGIGGFFAYKPIMNMVSPPEVSEEEAAKAGEPVDTSDPALFAPLNPPLVINFKDSYGEPHLLQVTMDVMSRDQRVIDEVKNHAAVIRNALILMYGNVDYDFIQTREGKEAMLDDALQEIRRIIERETGMTGVEAVYFTSLIIQ